MAHRKTSARLAGIDGPVSPVRLRTGDLTAQDRGLVAPVIPALATTTPARDVSSRNHRLTELSGGARPSPGRRAAPLAAGLTGGRVTVASLTLRTRQAGQVSR